jgi:hypothetical protein
VAKQIGTCDTCGKPVMSNQGRMAQQGMIFKEGREQYSDKKLWWHTACFSKKELGIEISSEPLKDDLGIIPKWQLW